MIIQLLECGFDTEEFHFNFTYSSLGISTDDETMNEKEKPKLIIKTHLISIKSDLYTQSQWPMRCESDALMNDVLCMCVTPRPQQRSLQFPSRET